MTTNIIGNMERAELVKNDILAALHGLGIPVANIGVGGKLDGAGVTIDFVSSGAWAGITLHYLPELTTKRCFSAIRKAGFRRHRQSATDTSVTYTIWR